jgi:WD40 repeat protein
VLFGTANGGIGEIDSKGKVTWAKREHGLDLIDKDPLGTPHRDVVGLDTHGTLFASLSNDDTLRIFELKSKKRRLRALVDGSLFNNCVFSPDGKWVAASCSAGLNLFDTTTGERLCELTVTAFKGSTSRTIVAFSGPRELLLGTENGNIYRISFS